jgi:hypothetical protein
LDGGFDEAELVHAETAHERGRHAAERRAKIAFERRATARVRRFQDGPPPR